MQCGKLEWLKGWTDSSLSTRSDLPSCHHYLAAWYERNKDFISSEREGRFWLVEVFREPGQYDHVQPHSDHSHAQYNKKTHCIVRRIFLSPSMSEKPSRRWVQVNGKNQVCRWTGPPLKREKNSQATLEVVIGLAKEGENGVAWDQTSAVLPKRFLGL